MGHHSTISFLRGMGRSTSVLSRRNMNGFKMACSLLTTLVRCSAAMISSLAPSWPTLEKSNHASKSSLTLNSSGMRKLSRDHSSLRLFCSGVPDSSRRFSAGMVRSSLMSLQSQFFKRWPSSTAMYCHLILVKKAMSAMMISKLVMITGKLSGRGRLSAAASTGIRISARSCLVPWYSSGVTQGRNRLNSLVQLYSVERGATMRKGPLMPFMRRWDKKPMVWTVLPSPIWSARMPFKPFWYKEMSHLTPMSW
mmetsp:Transcript_7922/g.13641  ORF Transcript_7922/g.13641 Transcript_7922/m.13641 type:complete len:252 (+) Transcript_7922:232-987(+)